MTCSCGSGLMPDRYRDDVFACELCKPEFLRRIFDEKLLDIFEEWVGTILMDPPPLGYEWQWADFLKGFGCEQVVGREEAQRRKGDNILFEDPNGESFEHWHARDRSVYVLVPRDIAERVLHEGKI